MASADEQSHLRAGATPGATADSPSHIAREQFLHAPMVGRYRLLEKIGEGGFGEVYVAEQKAPVRRRVALKIIKPGMDSRQVVARFEAERQALALMDHPNIAKVLDAGTTESGRPYFVMELVQGIPVTHYCDQNKVPPEQRLRLFIAVCLAIQHAHQKGIIHRDIKPSNILVALHDWAAVPKVIDFGIAKATHGELTDKTIYTEFQQFIGTPEYISPEQAQLSGLDVDTRSDIYSLGVVLYELLTGSTPFDRQELLRVGLDEMRRKIREVDPVRPSTRLSGMIGAKQATTAKCRGMEPPRLISLLRGDLDWIVMRCLEKDRARRYQTASDLAQDVERYLNNEAVSARPPSSWYRFAKLVRRNRLSFAAATAAVAVLVIGSCVSTWEAVRAERAMREQASLRAAAEMERTKADSARDVAEKAQAAESLQREHAETALAEAERQRAEGLVAQADALTQAKRWPDARARMEEAYDVFTAAKLDPRKAVYGLSDFNSLSPPCLLSFRGHSGCVASVDFSPDGQSALSGGYDGTLRVWDLCSGRQVRAIDCGEGDQIYRAVFSPDGKLALSGGTAMALKLWDMNSGRLMRTFMGHSGIIRGIVFSADGRRVLSAAQDNTVRLWNVADGTEIRMFTGHSGPVFCCDLSRDGRTAASGSQDGTIRFWGVDSGREIGKCVAQDGEPIFSVAFTPDGKNVLGGSWDWGVTLWNVASAKLVRDFPGHLASVNWVAISRDGKSAVSCSTDRMVKLWDISSGRELASYAGHTDVVRSVAIRPDGRTILSGSFDGTMKSWDMRGDQEVRRFGDANAGEPVFSVAFGRDGRTALSGRRQMQLWDVATGQELRRFPSAGRHLFSIAVSPDGRTALTENSGNRTTLWDVDNGAEVRSFAGHEKSVEWASFSPDGKTILSASLDKTIRLWDAASGQQLRVFNGHSDCVNCVVFSPDGKTALSASDDKTVRLWDVSSGELVRTFAAGDWVAFRVAFSPDGRTAVSSDYDRNTVLMWDIATGKLVREIHGHLAYLWGIAFGDDGRILFTVDQEGILKTWDVAGGREIRSFYRYQPVGNSVAAGAFSQGSAWALALREQGHGVLIGSDRVLFRDFDRVGMFHELEPAVEAAQRMLTVNAEDAAALAVMGRWWSFRHEDEWAVNCLERARAAGGAVSPLMLGQSYWNLGRLGDAHREYSAAMEKASTPDEQTYLRCCLAAIDRSPATQPVAWSTAQ